MVTVCSKNLIDKLIMDDAILITELNDFIFCPVSIYFHKVYGEMDRMVYQSSDQINGTAAHEAVDNANYSDRKSILQGIDVYCEDYRLVGKIDIFDISKGLLRERKKKIKQLFPGYIYQVYAQCYALREMGYIVNKIELYSIDDHKTYAVNLPENDEEMNRSFMETIRQIRNFKMEEFHQDNVEKCMHCIYEPACDRTLLEE